MDELERDGIVRDLFGVDGRRMASFERGEARRFVRALSDRDEDLARRIDDAWDVSGPGSGPWRYALQPGEDVEARDALEELRGTE